MKYFKFEEKIFHFIFKFQILKSYGGQPNWQMRENFHETGVDKKKLYRQLDQY